MKKISSLVLVLSVAVPALAAVPSIESVTLAQDSATHLLTVDYKLVDGPAVITVDFKAKTGDGSWVPVGGRSLVRVAGDVWRTVDKENGQITWDIVRDRPDLDAETIKAEVSAWALDDKPDYLVVDLVNSNDVQYYPSEEFVPGGVLSNTAYRITKLLLRRIPASGVEWMMGSSGEAGAGTDEAPHAVTLGHDYYMGVFPITQAQWALVQGKRSAAAYFNAEEAKTMRPVESVSYNEIRCADNSTAAAGGEWPADPYSGSFLDLLRKKSGLDFDLPSEAEWEFACRAGTGNNKWNDGSSYLGSNTDNNLPGRYLKNGGSADGGYTAAPEQSTVTNGTAVCGSYAPSLWGLYDMHGNVLEWCLDWYAADISGLNGAVNTTASVNRVRRGGCWWHVSAPCRSAARGSQIPTKREQFCGFRVCCRDGLK